MIQLHGDEDVIYIEQLRQQTDKEIWKAVRVKDTKDIKEAQQLPVDKLLLDTFTEEKDMYGGIDISSGIETDGYKDLKKMKEIMQITGGRHE